MPDSTGIEEHQSATLQFADVFAIPYGVDIDAVDVIGGIRYEQPRVLAKGVSDSIRRRIEIAAHMPTLSKDDVDARYRQIVDDLNQDIREYRDILSRYMVLCQQRDADEDQVTELREDLDDQFELVLERNNLLVEQGSYGTVQLYIDMAIDALEYHAKMNKLRLRLELIRELLMDISDP